MEVEAVPQPGCQKLATEAHAQSKCAARRVRSRRLLAVKSWHL